MSTSIYIRVVITGLGATLICGSANAGGATTAPHLRLAQPALTAAARPSAVLRKRGRIRPAITDCSGQGYYSFVGVQNAYNVAASNFSAILGGSENHTCDLYSSIVTGYGNLIDSSGSSTGVNGSSSIGGGDDNTIAGYESSIGAGGGNTIGGTSGSEDSFIAAGDYSTIFGNGSFIGAGGDRAARGINRFSNIVYGSDAFIGAGDGNSVSGNGAFIGAGGSAYAQSNTGHAIRNTVSGADAFVGAGDGNTVDSLAAFVGSGQNNTITPSTTGGAYGAAYSVVSGGYGNTVTSLIPFGARYGVIGGGHGNTLSSFNGVISGGQYNTARGDYAVVPGGLYNSAIGIASFAAGNGAKALTNGAFVWSDDASPATVLKSTGINQFLVRASGGVEFYSNAMLKSGVVLRPGAGSWSSLSDRASKTKVVALNPAGILAKVEGLPVSEWSYRTEDASIRHVGPMAQDFYAAFGVGEDDRHITTIDEGGVALAAIKGLATKNATLEAEVRRLTARAADLAARDADLAARDADLAARDADLAARDADLAARDAKLEAEVAALVRLQTAR